MRRMKRVSVSLVNLGALFSTVMFVGPPAAHGIAFSSPTNYPVFFLPSAVGVGDFNGDDRPDIAVATDRATIFLGDGNGGFAGPTLYPATSRQLGFLVSLTTADFNRDGKLDLAFASQGSNRAVVALGDGNGSFSSDANFATGGTLSTSIATADFNGDSNPDLAVTNAQSNNVSILLGDGAGSFTGPTNFSAGSSPWAIATGDFNSDGRADLVIGHSSAGQYISLLFGNGTGSFTTPANFTASTNLSVKIGDFNEDGNPDVGTIRGGSNEASLLLGDGHAGLGGATTFPAGAGTNSVALGDLDRDGHLDVITTNNGTAPGNISVLLGDGSGQLSGPANFPAGDGPISAAVADFNNDALLDIVVANADSEDVSVLLNTSPTTFPYPRPKGATPMRVSLVPAYQACTSANRMHGPPLAYGSCRPPLQLSPNLAVGTPDANGASAKSVGSVFFTVQTNTAPTPSNVLMNVSITDVRCRSGVATCSGSNTAGGADYTGQVQATWSLRITDKFNSPDFTSSGTVSDSPFRVTMPCSGTSDATVGGNCSIVTSANSVVPGSVRTGDRAVWETGQIIVFDGGPDGMISTPDNFPFVTQGVFVP